MFIYLFCSTGAWTQGLHLEPLHQLFFLWRVFQDICPGWLWTLILLIFASWVARIAGVSLMFILILCPYINYLASVFLPLVRWQHPYFFSQLLRFFIFLFFFLAVLGIEPRALLLLDRYSQGFYKRLSEIKLNEL
jgi:hypothetical protein